MTCGPRRSPSRIRTASAAVLVTLDVCGIDRGVSNLIRDTIKERHGLTRDRIVLSCSHTHCGPVTGTNLLTMYKIDADQHRRIVDYTKFLESSIVDVVDRAFAQLGDVAIFVGDGSVRLRRESADQPGEGCSRPAPAAGPGRAGGP